MEANMLVTYDPTHAGKAKEEVEDLLGKVDFLESGFEGVFLLSITGDPREAVKSLREMCVREPYRFKFTHKWIPIDEWRNADIVQMQEAASEMDAKLNPNESWKIDIGKRGSDLEERKLVMDLTEKISKPKVDLRKPQQIVKVEIVGDRAGFALLRPDEILDVMKQS